MVVAPLRPGGERQARELVEAGPPFDPQAVGLRRHDVYLSPHEVVFVFEGPAAERHVADVLDDMAVSASFAAWGPLLAGTPRLARPGYSWDRDASPLSRPRKLPKGPPRKPR